MNDNPFAPPTTPMVLNLTPMEQAKRRLARPATALIIMASTHAVFLSIPLVSQVIAAFQGTTFEITTIAQFNVVFQLAVMIFVSIGAAKMGFLESYKLGRIAAIISCIPSLSPMYILGIPFGIWALILLSKPEIKAAFVQRLAESVTDTGRMNEIVR